MNTSTPDFAAYARQLGLDRATYPALEAFKHLGVGESLGWDLIGQGALRSIKLTPKKTVVTAESIAHLLYERERTPPRHRRRSSASRAAVRSAERSRHDHDHAAADLFGVDGFSRSLWLNRLQEGRGRAKVCFSAGVRSRDRLYDNRAPDQCYALSGCLCRIA
jgi:hypothetical protein